MNEISLREIELADNTWFSQLDEELESSPYGYGPESEPDDYLIMAEGMDAFSRGESASANPYNDEYSKSCWKLGFEDGEWHDAQSKGEKAFEIGVDRTQCPYKNDARLTEAWLNGRYLVNETLEILTNEAAKNSDSPVSRVAFIVNVIETAHSTTLIYRPHGCSETEFAEWLLRYYGHNTKEGSLSLIVSKPYTDLHQFSIQLPSTRQYKVNSYLVITAQEAFSVFLSNTVDEALRK